MAESSPKTWATARPLDWTISDNFYNTGSQTHRPISRITLDCPIRTEIKLPKALRVMRKLRPLAAVVPNTAEKKRLAVTCSFAAITDFGTKGQLIRAGELTCSEISYIAQDVQDGDQAKTEWCRSFDSPDRVFDFAHHVEGILVTLIRESNVDKRIR
jgi:hypothetical protein